VKYYLLNDNTQFPLCSVTRERRSFILVPAYAFIEEASQKSMAYWKYPFPIVPVSSEYAVIPSEAIHASLYLVVLIRKTDGKLPPPSVISDIICLS
jgi:hypothetical protein